MRILYLCYNETGIGNGGHYFSLRTTAEEIQKTEATYIASIGSRALSVFSGMDNYYPMISNHPGPLLLLRLVIFVKKHHINVIHSFDKQSYLFGRILSIITRKPLVHTKCGGPAPRGYYPLVRDFVLYSNEDIKYFENAGKKYENLHYIPNRVKIQPQDQRAIQKLKERLRPNAIVFLRIARISNFYKKNIIDSIDLIKKLRNEGMDAQLLMIGFVYETEAYEEILKHKNKDVIIVTEKEFTDDASRLLSIADVVIGTGRGAMEAAILEKILLSTTKDHNIPVLVDEGNISIFFDYNFSSRTPLPGCSDEVVIQKIKGILVSEEKRNKLKGFIREYADKNFKISTMRDQYIHIYSNCMVAELHFMDITRDITYFIYNKYIKHLIKEGKN